MKWVSYTRSISSRIGEENPSNTIAEQNERIARYLKKRGCSVSEKYSDRKRTAEATEGFDKLVQDGMARKFDAVAVDSKKIGMCQLSKVCSAGLFYIEKCGAFRFSDEQYCRFVKEVEGFCYTLI